ncbi:SDR family NAD(P)-dependent oxidoreductase [Bacillota bacterium Meth-B3]|nr:SDR family oxidoreductase [Christensenellaceae bacterium]MEA5064935.1 SDR family oxidoreductase [Eubacteriales bacterium]MEA5068091.1 SDR family oxidoreductase [Christensenellaceae bacterium]
MTDDSRFSVANRTALVTGSTRGIGLAIALALRDAGADVTIHGTREQNTRELARKYGFKAVCANLKNEAERRAMAQSLCQSLPKLDILFNNAGFETYLRIDQADEAYLDDIYNVNARSPYLLVRDLLEPLRRSGDASIVNVTSIHQDIAISGNSSYCMAKASLAMFTKVASLELAKWNIRVNNLVPGAIETDMNRETTHSMPFSRWIPLGRTGKVEDVAGPALFLASPASRYMTGASLVVDGGYSQNLPRYAIGEGGQCLIEAVNAE